MRDPITERFSTLLLLFASVTALGCAGDSRTRDGGSGGEGGGGGNAGAGGGGGGTGGSGGGGRSGGSGGSSDAAGDGAMACGTTTCGPTQVCCPVCGGSGPTCFAGPSCPGPPCPPVDAGGDGAVAKCNGTAGGTCIAVPTSCPKDKSPVCGCDGKTYDNDCPRQMARQPSAQFLGQNGVPRAPPTEFRRTTGHRRSLKAPGAR